MTKTRASEPWRALSARGRRRRSSRSCRRRPRRSSTTIAREVPEYARPLEGAFGARHPHRGDRGAAPVRRPDPRPRGGPGARPRRLRRAGPRRAAPGPDPRLAAVRLPGRRAGRLAAGLGGRPAARRSTPSSSACSPRRSSPTSTSSPPTRSRATPRHSASRRASASAAAASCSRCCSAIRRPPTSRASAPRRRRRAGGCRGSAAPLAVARPISPALARRLPADALAASVGGIGCALVSGAAGPSASSSERPRQSRAALGPAVPRGRAGRRLVARRGGAARGGGGRDRCSRLDRGRGAPAGAAALRVGRPGRAPRGAQRWLRSTSSPRRAGRGWRRRRSPSSSTEGNAAAMARALHLHPQTIRYRLGRLRELFGDDLSTTPTRASSSSWRSGPVRLDLGQLAG